MKRLFTWATGAVRYQGPVGVCQRRKYGVIATWRQWQRGTTKYDAYLLGYYGVKGTHTVYPTVSFLQLDQTHDFGDIRRATSREWQTDYLIDVCPCDTDGKSNGPWDLHPHGRNGRKLALLAGTNRQVLTRPRRHRHNGASPRT